VTETHAAHHLIPPFPPPSAETAVGKLRKYCVFADGSLGEVVQIAPPDGRRSWFVNEEVVSGELWTRLQFPPHAAHAQPPLPPPHPTAHYPTHPSPRVSDGRLHVVTRVDPLYFLLPLLAAASETGEFLPAAALLRQQVSHEGAGSGGRGGVEADATSSAASRAHLGYATVDAVLSSHPRLTDALSSACDVSHVDDGTAYRLNRAQAVGVLADRVRSVARQLALKDVEAAARLKASMGGFSAASAAIPAPSPSMTSSSGPDAGDGGGGEGGEGALHVTIMHLYYALGVLSDQVADTWVAAVAARLE